MWESRNKTPIPGSLSLVTSLAEVTAPRDMEKRIQDSCILPPGEKFTATGALKNCKPRSAADD